MRSALAHWAILISCAGASSPAGGLVGQDCNQNGVEDALDVAPGAIHFPSIRLREVGGVAGAVASGDLNGDGLVDLAVQAKSSEGTKQFVAVFLGDGGDLGAPTLFPAPRQLAALAAADVNGDGFVDVACADQEASAIAILRGAGDGTLRAGTVHTVNAQPVSITAVDLDRDGDQDLVSAEGEGSSVTVLLQLESGVLSRTSYPISIQPSGVALADLDGDGDLDAAAAGAVPDTLEASAAFLLGDGLGALSHAQGFVLAPFPIAIASGDLDQDGDMDLLTSHASGASGFVALHRNAGDLGFEPPLDVPSKETPWSLVLVDLEEDGLQDIAFTADAFLVGHGSLSLVRNAGDWTFSPVLDHSAGDRPRGLVAVDLDRDGYADLAVTNAAAVGTVTIVSNDGGALGAAPFYTRRHGILATTLADLDRDGSLDLVTAGNAPADGSGAVSFHRNDASGGFDEALVFPVGKRPVDLIVTDLDGDGFADAAVADSTLDQVLVLRNSGDELLTREEHAVGTDPSAVIAMDLDRDGDLDLAATVLGPLDATCRCRLEGGEIAFLSNQGDGTFAPPVTRSVPCCPAAILAIDIDTDGDLDLLLANGGGEAGSSISVLRSDAGGPGDPTQIHLGGRPLRMAPADLDRDGDPDLTLAMAGGAVSVLWNAGGGAFEETPIDGSAEALLAADLDGDGAADLAFADGIVSVSANLGNRAFGKAVEFPVGDDTRHLQALDMDGDGRLDLAAVNRGDLDFFGCGCYGYGSIQVLGNRTRPAVSLDANRDGVPDECRDGFRRGDADANGTTDLTDAIFILSHLFLSGRAPSCLEAADSGNDGRIDLADPILILDHLFRGGAPPPAPGPGPGPCGPDTDSPGSVADLGCAEYGTCRG